MTMTLDGAPPRRGAMGRLASLLARLDRSTVEDGYLVFETLAILAVGVVLLESYVARALDIESYRLIYVAPIALGLAAMVVSLRAKGLYQFGRLSRFSQSVGDVLVALVRAFAGLAVLGFALNVANDYSRVWVLGWFAATVPVVLLVRAFAARLAGEMMAQGHVLRHAAIYGPRVAAETVAEQLREARTGVGVSGIYGPGNGTDGLHALLADARSRRIDAIIVVMDPRDASDVEAVVEALAVLPVELRLHVVSRSLAPLLGTSDADGLRTFAVQGPPLTRAGRVVKALLDRVGAAVLLVALSPLLAAVALWVRLDSPGPVIFRQSRLGFNQRRFSVWKFRTMSVTEDGDAVVQARRNDARVTRSGHWLRRTSVDELPQLVNVLIGDMSLVGPRPHPVSMDSHYETLLKRYAGRQKVKPGITGLAQINGLRGPTPDPETMRRRLEQDLRYIENWSLWLDIRILAATPFLGIVNRNAF